MHSTQGGLMGRWYQMLIRSAIGYENAGLTQEIVHTFFIRQVALAHSNIKYT